MEQDLQKELMWASGSLVAFLALLVFSGANEIGEIGIAIGAFAVSWTVISYSVKNFGPGSTSKEDLQNKFTKTQKDEQKFIEEITKKYGDGTLNPETGTFIPNK